MIIVQLIFVWWWVGVDEIAPFAPDGLEATLEPGELALDDHSIWVIG